MNILILYSTTTTPFGGANQFIRALKHFFAAQGMLTKNISRADVIMLNNFSLGGNYGKAFRIGYLLKALFPATVFINRIDGPVQLYGNKDRAGVDTATYRLNQAVADGTIFQSHWSREQNKKLGLQDNHYETTIPNAADPTFFFPPPERIPATRIRLIATSWSNHFNKGFDIYSELDQRLDWSRFTMTFVGRTPRTFKNIVVHDAVPSAELGELLRSHDIYVTASQNDPCSNALLEALACGLPVVARASGGHPELVGQAGELFENTSQAITALERVADNISHYRRLAAPLSMKDVGAAYTAFFEQIIRDVKRRHYTTKRLPLPLAVRHIFH